MKQPKPQWAWFILDRDFKFDFFFIHAFKVRI